MADLSKVLVVDDDLSLSFLISEALQSADFIVEEVSSGEACIEKIDDIDPDIVLLDVLMPGLNGYDVCEQIRKKSQFKHTPVLMMTGMDDELSVQSSFLAGATDFIGKPFNINLFLQRVLYIDRNGQTMKDLVHSERRLEQAQKLAKLAYWELDTKTQGVVWSNTAASTFKIDALSTTPSLEALLERVPAGDKRRVDAWLNYALADGEVDAGITHAVVNDDDETIYLHQQIKPYYNNDGELSCLYGSVLDVTEIQHAQHKIRKLAYYDTLTDLPNRAHFKELLEHVISNAKRYKRQGALFFIDLDNFKRVNDTMGHQNGDALLKHAATVIQQTVRDGDIVVNDIEAHDAQLSRLGGDEFTLLLPEVGRPENAAMVAERIINALKQPFNLDGNEVAISASIGIALILQDGETADELLCNSDIAMYYAKGDGKNTFRFFNQEMNLEVKNRVSMENALRLALKNNEFSLVYQPQIDIDNGQIHGVEALLRWHSPTMGQVYPLDFIPLAEENGMIIPIGNWVIREACQQAKKWLESGMQLNRIAVNVSSRQFSQTDFDRVIEDILIDVGLPAQYLELEMTESLLMKQAEEAINILNRLKQIGVSLSIDDFGTGYSSLSYLKQFPIDHLKIDKAFIDDVDTDQDNAAIVKAVIAMAANMNLRVTAEGVEVTEQLDFLKNHLCNEVQGYFFSKPLGVNEVEGFAKQFDAKQLETI